jgi:hypothetical protein
VNPYKKWSAVCCTDRTPPKREDTHKRVFSFWQAAPFKITMISPVFSRISATFGNPFPIWRGVLLDGHCATQKDIA